MSWIRYQAASLPQDAGTPPDPPPVTPAAAGRPKRRLGYRRIYEPEAQEALRSALQAAVAARGAETPAEAPDAPVAPPEAPVSAEIAALAAKVAADMAERRRELADAEAEAVTRLLRDREDEEAALYLLLLA